MVVVFVVVVLVNFVLVGTIPYTATRWMGILAGVRAFLYGINGVFIFFQKPRLRRRQHSCQSGWNRLTVSFHIICEWTTLHEIKYVFKQSTFKIM